MMTVGGLASKSAATGAREAPRRTLLIAGVALLTSLLAHRVGATPQAMAAALADFTGGAPLRSGRVRLEVATLVDNGNTVPVTVRVDSPMSPASHVVALALFNERNPQPEVIRVRLGPNAGRAELSTRIRLATTQNLLAVAQLSDGSFWSDTVEVIVTLAACIETDGQS